MIFYDKNQPEISTFPAEVNRIIKANLEIYQSEWNVTKENYLYVGGFVLVAEAQEDLEILNRYNIDLDTDIPEYVDNIPDKEGDWIVFLLLVGDDYGIVVLMKKEMATENILSYMA